MLSLSTILHGMNTNSGQGIGC